MDNISDILAVLAEPRRRAVVEILADGERCLCDISRALAVSDQLASHHVKRLRDAGLVLTSRRGPWLYCRLEPNALDGIADAFYALAERCRATTSPDAACCIGECAPAAKGA